MEPKKRIGLGLLLLGVAAGVAVGLLVASKSRRRWTSKARAGVARGREAVHVIRDALEVLEEFRSLGRPLEEDRFVEHRGRS